MRLKPFEGPSPTGFYNFSGKPLDQSEVDILRAAGTRIPEKPFEWNPATKESPGYNSKEWDIMPDNRLKHPRFHKKRLENRDLALQAQRENKKNCFSREYQNTRWEEYQKLQEPRPDYFEWAAQYNRREMYDNLERIAFNSKRDSDRTKAALAILEFSKSKPKQTVENINAEVRAATAEELLNAVAAIFDKPLDFVREALMGKPQ